MATNFRVRDEESGLQERLVEIKRVFKVHKGGRRAAFRALVVVGDGEGNVGASVGKALSVPEAIRKGYDAARKRMIKVPTVGTTIPHEITNRFCASKVMLRPASPGTGVIAGLAMRFVLEAAGIRDVLAKVIGSRNNVNTVTATMEALQMLRHPLDVAKERNCSVDEMPLPAAIRRLVKRESKAATRNQTRTESDRVSAGSEGDGEGSGSDPLQ